MLPTSDFTEVVSMSNTELRPGCGLPLGAVATGDGVQFTLFSRHATGVWLALFNSPDDTTPAAEFAFDVRKHRIGDVWSVFVAGLGHGALYAYRVDGPNAPEKGHCFDASRYLLDPCAGAFAGSIAEGGGKCVVVETPAAPFDDTRPRTPMEKTVIYETHVRGFTKHASSGVSAPGTYRGLTEKIPYLKKLGITAVELLPVQECGEASLDRINPFTGARLTNYWGYNPIGFFAPTQRYASDPTPGAAVAEFREMVATLHQAGIEVFLDVVFNHTAEGNADGTTLSFRGIDNAVYYLLGESGKSIDVTGCGNTFNCSHPVVQDLIIDCLRHWVAAYHVDGFRFDLAAALMRDSQGRLDPNAPLIQRIASDPLLRDVKLIAEPWDLGEGGYLVGSFGGKRWAEWNGMFRDDLRRFWRGDSGYKPWFAQRFTGSPDYYAAAERPAWTSVNFITAHDGFTLRDLVSYTRRRNIANGEDNRDGTHDPYSENCGCEGWTSDAAVNDLRLRLQKTYLATVLLATGTPMLLGGDEFGRTQQGNTNAYCQDNTVSWGDWSLPEKHAGLARFCEELIRFRKANPAFSRTTYLVTAQGESDDRAEVLWFNESGEDPAWDRDGGGLIMRISAAANGGTPLCLLFNRSRRGKHFIVPEGMWRMRVDTAQTTPKDIPATPDAPKLEGGKKLRVEARSLIVLSADEN
jgi:isoamylase